MENIQKGKGRKTFKVSKRERERADAYRVVWTNHRSQIFVVRTPCNCEDTSFVLTITLSVCIQCYSKMILKMFSGNEDKSPHKNFSHSTVN